MNSSISIWMDLRTRRQVMNFLTEKINSSQIYKTHASPQSELSYNSVSLETEVFHIFDWEVIA
ncbi:MAG: hypothetical protein R6U96_15045 [Promethearchaeia archaeon]